MVTLISVPTSPGSISKMSIPVSFEIAAMIGWARKPAASTPARATNCCCWAADSWLVDVLKTISERMSD